MKITLKKLLGYVAGLLAVVALLLPLAAAFVTRTTGFTGNEVVTTYTNLYAFIFGGTVAVQGASGSLNGSLEGPVALVLIGWILLVLGTLGIVAALFIALSNIIVIAGANDSIVTVEEAAEKKADCIIVIAAIIFFASKSALVTAALGEDLANQIMGSVSLGFGPIGTGIFALLSGASCVGSAILKK